MLRVTTHKFGFKSNRLYIVLSVPGLHEHIDDINDIIKKNTKICEIVSDDRIKIWDNLNNSYSGEILRELNKLIDIRSYVAGQLPELDDDECPCDFDELDERFLTFLNKIWDLTY